MVEQKGRDGQRIGNYRLRRLLGRGGFAEVYLAEHLYLNTQAAVKLLSTQLANESIEGFRNEAQMIAGLVHPRIVRVLDFGVEDSVPYLVMDYAPNGTLRQRHPRGARLPLPLVVSYVQQIAGALQYAHERRLIHRDVKPENMLGGSNDEVLLSDFGIALVAQSSRYQHTQNIAGTLAYMAPEQIQAHPRPASDQYALGIVVYEWLGGQRPFQGTMTEIAIKHATAAPPPLRQLTPALPPAAEHVVLTALSKDPHDRFPTVQAFAQALEQASKHFSQSLAPSPAPAPPASGPFPSHPSVSQHPSVHPGASTARHASHSGSPAASSYPSAWTPATASPHPGAIPGSATTQPGSSAALPYPSAWTPATASPHPGAIPGSTTTRPGSSAALLYPSDWTPATASPHPGSIPGSTTPAWQTPNQFTHTWQSGQPALPAQGRRFSRRVAISALAGGAAAVGSVVAYTAFIGSRNGPSSPQGQSGLPTTHPGTTPTSPTNTTPATSTPALMTFSDHPKTIWAVSWSPDGKYIASASDDGTSHVWNVANRQRIFSYHSGIQPAQSDDGAYSVAWLPNSTGIAVGFGDGTAQIVNLAARRQIGTYDSTTGGDLSGHLYAVAISPNSRSIALAGFFSDDVQIFDIGTQRRVRALVGHTDSVWSLAWSHNGRYLASGSADTTARVWDWQSGKQLLIYDKQGDDVRTVSWSPDDMHIASSGLSGPVYIWTSDTGQTQLTYGTQADFEILAVAWSPDGRYIASAGGSDASTHVWNARNGQLLRAFPASAINSVSWSPDSAHLVTANNSVVQVWQL
jgi:serine/threonine protein kinase